MIKEEKLEIFFIRHADTSGKDRGDRDNCDIDLSTLGIRQAELLSERFAGVRFDAVLSSPLVRTVRTAAAVANRLNGKPVIELVPELIEKGATPGYAGCSVSYLNRYYDKLSICEENIFGSPGGNFPNVTKPEAMERARALVAYLRRRFTYGQKIVMFSHASFGNSFLPSAIGIIEEDYRMTLFNTSVSKIKYTPDGVKRLSFQNDVSHLLSIMPDFQFDI